MLEASLAAAGICLRLPQGSANPAGADLEFGSGDGVIVPSSVFFSSPPKSIVRLFREGGLHQY
jgi:hypothetical protein